MAVIIVVLAKLAKKYFEQQEQKNELLREIKDEYIRTRQHEKQQNNDWVSVMLGSYSAVFNCRITA